MDSINLFHAFTDYQKWGKEDKLFSSALKEDVPISYRFKSIYKVNSKFHILLDVCTNAISNLEKMKKLQFLSLKITQASFQLKTEEQRLLTCLEMMIVKLWTYALEYLLLFEELIEKNSMGLYSNWSNVNESVNYNMNERKGLK